MIQTSQIWDELSLICKPSRRLITVVPTPTLLHTIGSCAMSDKNVISGRGGVGRVHYNLTNERSIMLIHSIRKDIYRVLKEQMIGVQDQDVAFLTFEPLFEHQHYEMSRVVSAYRGTLKIMVVR